MRGEALLGQTVRVSGTTDEHIDPETTNRKESTKDQDATTTMNHGTVVDHICLPHVPTARVHGANMSETIAVETTDL